MKHLTVVIISPSAIVTEGLRVTLANIKGNSLNIITTTSADDVKMITDMKPSLIIADPISLDNTAISEIRENTTAHIAAVAATTLPQSCAKKYDTVISLYEPATVMRHLLEKITAANDNPASQPELSNRERDIVKGIVKGMSNKEIADDINLSVNTVMTHRRNIARKLQIHSPAALTVYAIVRNLVKIEEIKTILPSGI